MLLDFHTHNELKSENVERIFNVILGEDKLNTKDWLDAEPISLGIHPWYIDNFRLTELYDLLYDYGKQPEVKYIGEIGLDKLKGLDFELQKEVFVQQIQIAEELHKPVVIHCVKAFNELIVIKRKLKPNVPMIIHGFGKKKELAEELLTNGFSLSFGRDLLLKEHVQLALKAVPLDKMFFETDDSDEICISEVYAKAAEILGLEQKQLEEIIYQNFRELYI